MPQDDLLRLFVVGCARGGTTITQRLIKEGLNLYSLPETHFFMNLIGASEEHIFPRTHRHIPWMRRQTSRLRRMAGLGTGREFLSFDESLRPPAGRKLGSVRQATRKFTDLLDTAAREAGCAGWLEKSPVHVHYAKDIQRLVPDAWMVHVIRDPKDTVASIWSLAQSSDPHWSRAYGSLDRAIDHWNAATEASAAMVGQPRQIFLSYETLSREPDQVLSRISERIGVPLVKPGADRPQVIANDNETWKTEALSGPVRPAKSKWDTALTPEEQARANEALVPLPASLMRAMEEMKDDGELADKRA